MTLLRKMLAVTVALAFLAQTTAEATTYFYYRSGSGTQQTAPPPASPAAPGIFAILVDPPTPAAAVVGSAYSATTYAYSNVGPVVFSLQSGSLPPGVSVDPTTGTISGTPTTTGSTSAVIQGLDTGSGQTATASLSVLTVDPFSITASPAATAVVGKSYSASFTLAGGSQPYGFSTGALPPGLAMTTGATVATISGVPTAAGTYSVAVTGSDANGFTATFPYSLTVDPALTLAASYSGTATLGSSYVAQFTATGGAGGYVYSLASGSLPPGLSLNSTNGTVSGTPSLVGTYSGIAVKVVDAAGFSIASSPFSIVVSDPSPITVFWNPSTTSQVGASLSSFASASGGTPSKYVYSLVGSLPPGISLSPNGAVGGTYTTAGTFGPVAVKVSDGTRSGTSPQVTFHISPLPLYVQGAPTGFAYAGTPYSIQFTATGGTGKGYVYSVSGGPLPPGLSLNTTTGLLSGTPTVQGNYGAYGVKVVDSSSNAAYSVAFDITVKPPQPLSISGSPAATAKTGSPYSAQFTGVAGAGGYVYAMIGALPPGLSLNTTSGLISGTPTATGTFSGLQVKVTDAASATATSAAFSIAVTAPLAISGTPSASASKGVAYSAQFSATGGTGGDVYAMVGSLPPGLTLDGATGLISGTPTATGTFSGLRVKVTDSSAATATSASFSITVALPPLAVSGVPATGATVGTPYSAGFTATGGSGTGYVYAMVGTLPPGLSLNTSSGLISGTPTAAGTFSGLQVRAKDSLSNTAVSAAFQILVAPPPPPPMAPLTISGTPVAGYLGQAYSVTFTAGGGAPSYLYSVSGTLPPGLSLDPASGVLSGVPTAVGSWPNLQVTVTDSAANVTSTPTFSIAVTDANPLTISWTPQTAWTVGDFATVPVNVSGGDNANYSFSALGTLPPGMTLFSNGALYGTLTQAGTYGPIQIQVADGYRTATTAAATFVVSAPPPLTVSGSPAPNAVVGSAYSASFSAAGGSGTGYVYAMSGSLPPGLALDPATGIISGTPTASGVYAALAVQATDSASNSATSSTFSITVSSPPPLAVSGSPAANAGAGSAYSAQFTASGGAGGYVYAMVGSLPPGLALNTSTGLISGATTTAGSYSGLAVQVSDAASNTASSATFSITVAAAASGVLTVAGNAPSATVGYPYGGQYVASGGSGAGYAYAMIGSLPPGLSLNSATGAISGTPTTAGFYSGLQVQATDSGGNSGVSAGFSIAVNDPQTPLTITGTPPLGVNIGGMYSAQFTATGGIAPYSYSVVGSLPSGLSINPTTGLLSGIAGGPANVNYPNIEVEVVDKAGDYMLSQPFSIETMSSTVNVLQVPQPPVAFLSIANGATYQYNYDPLIVQQGFAHQNIYLVADDAYSFGNTLYTDHLGVSDTGVVSGTVQYTQPLHWHYYAYDASGNEWISPPLVVPVKNFVTAGLYYSTKNGVAVELPNADTGNFYSVKMGYLSGGSGAPFWNASHTNLSGSQDLTTYFGLQVSIDPSSGNFTIFGTPTNPGTWTGIICGMAAEGDGACTATVQIVVIANALAISGSAPPTTVLGQPYTANFAGQGGSGSYTYTQTGTLPPGLSFSGGVISGASTTAGTYPDIVVTVADGGSTASTAPFSITVQPAPLAIAGTPSANAVVGTAYSAQFTASGGTGSYTYSMVGTLPAGLTLGTTSGVISGTPTAVGSYSGLQVKVTDTASAAVVSTVFTITVANPLSVSGSPAATASVSVSYSAQFTANGGAGGYVYTMIGSLPPGLSLNAATGLLSGTPTATGTYAGLQVQVTDSAAATATSPTFTIAVAAATAPAPSESLIVSVTGGMTIFGTNTSTLQSVTEIPDANVYTGGYVEVSEQSPIVIQYSQPVAVTGVYLAFYCPQGSAGANQSYPYTIDSSDDGVTWTTRASGGYITPMTCPAAASSTGLGTFTPATAQYWRFQSWLNAKGVNYAYWDTVDWFRPK